MPHLRPPPLALLPLAAALAPGPAGAADNGHELLAQCRSAVALLDGAAPEQAGAREDAHFCLGFVQGITNVVSIGYYVKPDGQMFCPPDGGIDPREAVRLLVDYLDAHPERLHARKVTLAAAAFMQAYPCGPNAAPRLFGAPPPAR